MAGLRASSGTLSVGIFLGACWILFFFLIYEGTASRESWITRTTMVAQGVITFFVLVFTIIVLKKLYG